MSQHSGCDAAPELLPPGLVLSGAILEWVREALSTERRAKSAIVKAKQQVPEESSTVELHVFSTADVQVGKTTRNTEPWGLAGEAIG